jgi:mannose-1-phosphate guanylyltransferase
VVLLVGGPTSGTRFRPLTFDLPKPLVPLGGLPLLAHHINACAQLLDHGLIEVLLLGFFKEGVFEDFCSDASDKLGVPVVYRREPSHLGTAGGIAYYHDHIISGFRDADASSNTLFIIHGDVLCPFPLVDMLREHQGRPDAAGVILAHQVAEADVHHYGCLVSDPNTQEILHYVEKPGGSQVPSNTVNCGVYLFSLPRLYSHLEAIKRNLGKSEDVELPYERLSTSTPALNESGMSPRPPSPANGNGNGHGNGENGYTSKVMKIRMEQNLLPVLAEEQQLFVHHLKDWWIPIKHPAAALDVAMHLMESPPASYKIPYPMTYKTSADSPNIIGNVFIHPSATIDPTARIGPNVSICENVTIGAGVRVSNSIIFPHTTVHDRACILYSIICGDSVIGKWARVEGLPKGDGITVIGKDVGVSPEVLLRSVVVLPHKTVSEDTESKIIL